MRTRGLRKEKEKTLFEGWKPQLSPDLVK